ncbi:Gfo/Idh/MocA family oxidoreductase [Rothia halotolerans]|uniref:Gfo/Idh/MocA family oxidoreductase n=1 Tax=Rothia halotolerans TaxID=405770 RepID=UPI001EDDCF75|nr:Gfo/Idh/MocA family oxidoreductase [Rothia halotolerans]
MNNDQPLRIGIVGYGKGGREYHAPFIEAAEGVRLAGVVARSEEKRRRIEEDLPGTAVYGSLTEMLAAGVDAVTITTPPSTRRDLVLEAVGAGTPVVADKPFAPDPATARELCDAAREAGIPLAAFHNRRWDADVTTLRAVLAGGRVGRPVSYSSVFDLVEPEGIALGVGGGVLSDIGSHLIDQAVSLFGPVASVYGELEVRPLREIGVEEEGEIDTGFFAALVHASGVRSHVESSKMGKQALRRLRLVGTEGTYAATGVDVQGRALGQGARPAEDPEHWGYEPEPGSLATSAGAEAVPSEQGSYARFYEQFARAVRGEAELPVTADDAVHIVDVIDAVRASALERRVVELS